jgi:hypothetical protein
MSRCTECNAEAKASVLFCASCGSPLRRPITAMGVESSVTAARQTIRLVLGAAYAALAAGALIFIFQAPAGYETVEYLVYPVGYGIAVAAAVMLATHLPSGALSAGVRRAFQLTAIGVAALAAGNLFGELWYLDRHVQGGYEVGAVATFLGSSLLAIAYRLWSREQASD